MRLISSLSRCVCILSREKASNWVWLTLLHFMPSYVRTLRYLDNRVWHSFLSTLHRCSTMSLRSHVRQSRFTRLVCGIPAIDNARPRRRLNWHIHCVEPRRNVGPSLHLWIARNSRKGSCSECKRGSHLRMARQLLKHRKHQLSTCMAILDVRHVIRCRCREVADLVAHIRWSAGLFIYQSLDAIDGKQARRTGSSSPLGEVFDHGASL